MSYSRNRLLFISRLIGGCVFLILCSIFLSVGSLRAFADDNSSLTSTPNCISPTDSSTDNSSSGDTSTSDNGQTTIDDNVNSTNSENSTTGTATVTDTNDSSTDNSNTVNDPTTPSNNSSDVSTTNDNDDQSTNQPTCNSDQTSDNSSDTTDGQCPTDQNSDNDSNDPISPATTSDNTGVTIDGCSQQNSSSGQATVETTGSGGSSTSGNSDGSLNEVNEISTTDNTGSPTTQPVTFTDDVYGNQNGNIEINPDAIAGEQSSSDNQSDAANTNSTSVNSDSSINNNDSVTAETGDASDLNDGGDGTATSGNAEALANVVNIIDSMITDGQSFVGTVNIYGNFNGNILIPEQLVDELLSEPTTSVSGGSDASNSISANITNNVELTAGSGDALVTNDGSDGTATSGNSSADIYTVNDVNETVDASNLFLIIINVSGQWYGYVLGVTPQSNIIILGGGLLSQQFTQSSPAVEATSSESITNNIDLTAESGNATVETNGSGGTATSGNAEAAANIINIIDDDFDISNWFGVLFINVFGNWIGSIETYNADPPSTPLATYDSANTNSYQPIVATDEVDPPSGYWVFIPVITYHTIYTTSYRTIMVPVTTYKKTISYVSAAQPSDPKSHLNYWYIALSFIPLLLLVAGERFAKYRKNRS